MMRPVKLAIVAAAIYGAWGIVINNFPTSPWLDYRSVMVLDSDYGQPLQIISDRDINRPIFTHYSVVVREAGRPDPVCSLLNGGGFEYQSSWNNEGVSVQLEPKPLEYWTDGECIDERLKPGFYTITTDWTFERPWPLPPGRVTMVSNVFEVRPK